MVIRSRLQIVRFFESVTLRDGRFTVHAVSCEAAYRRNESVGQLLDEVLGRRTTDFLTPASRRGGRREIQPAR